MPLGTKSSGSVAGQLDLRGAFLRRTDLSYANLEGANLTGADFTNALFRGANFKDAILDGTILHGADLSDAKNLSLAQLKRAVIDAQTKLPDYIPAAEVL